MTDAQNMKLYAVHTGFYDQESGFGIYESHTNMFVVASSPQEARTIVKNNPLFKARKMHIDGIQELQLVQGYQIKLEKDQASTGESVIQNFDYDEINASPSVANAS